MRTWLLLLILVAGLAGCGSPTPAKQAPVRETDYDSFADPQAHPVLSADSFWAPDQPVELPPAAFGPLTVDPSEIAEQMGKPITWSVGTFHLQTALPEAPSELPVYQVGAYPAAHLERFLAPEPWFYSPELSLVMASGPITLEGTSGTRAEAVRSLLRSYDLLPDDSLEPVVLPVPDDDSEALVFFRMVGGIPVYGDKPACAIINADGELDSFSMRRRPLLAFSNYPLRTPEEAFHALQQGDWAKPGNMLCKDGGHPMEGRVEQFVVTKVELAYWEPASLAGREPMLPYYVFRSQEGYTVYVPAIHPDWVADK